MPARSYGRPIESVYRLCLSLARIGWDVRALTTNANGPGEILPVNTRYEHAASAGFDVRYCPRIMRQSVSPVLLRYLIPYVHWADVVHLTGVYWFPTIPTLIACRLLRRPLIWSPRGALQRRNASRRATAKDAWEILCSLSMPRATLLHLTSEQERKESLKRFARLPTTVIPNGVALPQEAAHESGDGTLRLGYSGRLDPAKGIENLFAACRILIGEGIRFHLRVAGGGEAGYERQLRSEVAAPELAARVALLGPLAGAAKRQFFAETDIAVVPSYSENAIIVAQALAHGVPVIASRGTPWARVEEIGCGHWVDNDPATLARTIREMAREPLGEMGRRGRQWMSDEFSWERVARNMSAVYTALIGNEVAADFGAGKIPSANPRLRLRHPTHGR